LGVSAIAVEHHNSLRQPADLSTKFDLVASLEPAIHSHPGVRGIVTQLGQRNVRGKAARLKTAWKFGRAKGAPPPLLDATPRILLREQG
jgi:hypothetical protein